MKKIFRKLSEKSPTILCCVAAAGVISSIIFSVKATPKAMKKIEKMKEPVTVYYDNEPVTITPPEPTKKAIIKAVWKDYIPAALIGVGTIACIFGANVLNKKKQAMLTSAYAALSSQYLGYSNEVKRLFGNEAHEEVMNNIVIKDTKNPDIITPTLIGLAPNDFNQIEEEEILIYLPFLHQDSCKKQMYKSTPIKVLNAEIAVMRNYAIGGTVTINDFCYFLGIDPIQYGDDLGWEIGSGMYCVDFEHIRNTTDDDTLEYWIINPVYWPEPFEKYE